MASSPPHCAAVASPARYTSRNPGTQWSHPQSQPRKGDGDRSSGSRWRRTRGCSWPHRQSDENRGEGGEHQGGVEEVDAQHEWPKIVAPPPWRAFDFNKRSAIHGVLHALLTWAFTAGGRFGVCRTLSVR